MTTIVIDKTWLADEYVVPAQTTGLLTNKNIILNIKTLMKNHNWSVVSSSNSTIADTNDNWNAVADIVWAISGSIHSWIVLKNTAISANFQVCFDLSNATPSYLTCAVSYTSGFTSGSTTARPTATDEVVICPNALFNWSSTDVTSVSITMLYSSDFKCNRIYFTPQVHPDGDNSNLFIFDVPKDPVSWWDERWIAGVKYIANGSVYSTLCISGLTGKLFTRINGTACNLSFAAIGAGYAYGDTDIGSSVDYNGAYILSPIPVVSLVATRAGFLGMVSDMYWAGGKVPHGTYISTASGDKKFFVCGNLALANNGSNRMR